MDDSILHSISGLIDEEHALHRSHRDSTTPAERDRLDAIEVGLDQCWDLLRQRRARRAAHQDAALAAVRPPEVVERYLQ